MDYKSEHQAKFQQVLDYFNYIPPTSDDWEEGWCDRHPNPRYPDQNYPHMEWLDEVEHTGGYVGDGMASHPASCFLIPNFDMEDTGKPGWYWKIMWNDDLTPEQKAKMEAYDNAKSIQQYLAEDGFRDSFSGKPFNK